MVAAVKSETVTFRGRPEVKAALREAAEREHRSLGNMLGVMIRADRAQAEAVADNRNRRRGPQGQG
jgi:hypothetical protein